MSARVTSRVFAGVVAAGVGLVVATGSGVAAANAAPSESKSSSSSSDSGSSSKKPPSGTASSGKQPAKRSDSEARKPSPAAKEPAVRSSGDAGTNSPSDRDNDQKDTQSNLLAGDSSEKSREPSRKFGAAKRSETSDTVTPEPEVQERIQTPQPVRTVEAAREAPVVELPVGAPTVVVPMRVGKPLAAIPAEAKRVKPLPVPGAVSAVRIPVAPAPNPVAPQTQFLAGALGLASRDLENQSLYGDPARNMQYWVGQTSMNCLLMATSMVIGQLTGKTPNEAQSVFDAMHTPSVTDPNKIMYKGLKSNDGISIPNAMQLLRNHGITPTARVYPNNEQALEDMKQTLNDPNKAMIVGVNSGLIWRATQGYEPAQVNTADHAVVVIGLDTATNTVYINDSGTGPMINPATGRPWGQATAVPLDVFMQAWHTDQYLTIITEVTGEPKPSQEPWLNVRPAREALENPQQNHMLHYRN